MNSISELQSKPPVKLAPGSEGLITKNVAACIVALVSNWYSAYTDYYSPALLLAKPGFVTGQ